MIHFSNDLQAFRAWLEGQSFSQICVLTDENTAVHCYPLLAEALAGFLPLHFSIPSGEQHKTLPTCETIWAYWLAQYLDRKALIINLGGGVVGDMGGFCAATYKRGIQFVQMPTTLLAQVDASVGGKLGIDFQGYKNVIGSFQEPIAVWINTDFLKTLPARELRAGMGEVLKYSFISPSFEVDWTNLACIVRESVAVKKAIVETDYQEQGLRKILNFGHTIGHALETYFLLNKTETLLHGEAVAEGMLAEAYLSMRYAGLGQASFEVISERIRAYFPETLSLTESEIQAIAHLACQDKKNIAQEIRCVLLEEVGKAVFDVPITVQDIMDALIFTVGNRD
jgi:3-dehydroquinate synthase